MIEFHHTSKTYRSLLGRTVVAIDDFSLQVNAGEVLGIAGPNGAGKSTLIALLMGYLRPTSGNVTIEGSSPRAYIETHGVSYVSELIKINPRWTTEQALQRYATLAGIAGNERMARVESQIQRLGLTEHRDKRFRALSKGNAQRLGIAQALLLDHPVVIFDEPTHGLDPVWTLRFRDIVNELRRPNRTIIIASHNLDELQRLADRVAIIDHGRLQRVVLTRSARDAEGPMTYRLQIIEGASFVPDAFPDVVAIGDREFDIHVRDLVTLNRGLAELLRLGGLISGITPLRSVLEEEFHAVVGD